MMTNNVFIYFFPYFPRDLNFLECTFYFYIYMLKVIPSSVSHARGIYLLDRFLLVATKLIDNCEGDRCPVVVDLHTVVSVERSTGSVTTPNGAATLYIDGREVDFREVQSLRPKDVSRVEYFDVPTGKYAKDAYAINIIMKPLNNGGYTQLDASQNVGYLHGDYNLISKFVTGTKSLNLWAGYSLENPKSSMDENETFIFPDYQLNRLQHYNNADNRQTEDGSEASESSPASLPIRSGYFR